jgi:hypothetical protein
MSSSSAVRGTADPHRLVLRHLRDLGPDDPADAVVDELRPPVLQLRLEDRAAVERDPLAAVVVGEVQQPLRLVRRRTCFDAFSS